MGSSLSYTQAASVTIGANSLLIVPNGFDPNTSFASYHNDGLLHNAGTTLAMTAGQGFSGQGTIEDFVDCQGNIEATAAGYVNLYNGLAVSGAGSVDLGSGQLRVNDTLSGVSGGSLTASALYLGYSSNANAGFSLSGTGQLDVGSEYIGYGTNAIGLLQQNGGNHTANFVSIGAKGQYQFSGGALTINRGLDSQGAVDFAGGAAVFNASNAPSILGGPAVRLQTPRRQR